MVRSIWLPCVLTVFLVAPLSEAKAADPTDISVTPELAGNYDFVSDVPNVGRLDGRAEVMLNGQAYDFFRTSPNGVYGVGFGMEVDGILGAVMVPFPRDYADHMGIVIYRIDGGTLKGYRLSERGQQREVGREELTGPTGLDGRYTITLSARPGGEPYHAGYVELHPFGDVYLLQWYTPEPGPMSVAIKLGDLLIASFRDKNPVGVVAYCIGPDRWVGIGGRPDRETLSLQSMARGAERLPKPSGTPIKVCPR